MRPLRKISHYYRLLGCRGLMAFLMGKATRTQPLVKIRVPGIRHPVYVRACTTDASVYAQVLVEKHYEFELPINPRFIIDAGANIGLAAVYFANRVPDATIVAVEPEAGNYAMLCQNTALYPQIRPLRAALWSENCRLHLFDPGQGSHGFQIRSDSAGSGAVDAVTVDYLLQQAGMEGVDLLKIDIEGAEKEVFEASAGWRGRMLAVMAELHENLKPGCNAAFETATAHLDGHAAKGETIAKYRKP